MRAKGDSFPSDGLDGDGMESGFGGRGDGETPGVGADWGVGEVLRRSDESVLFHSASGRRLRSVPRQGLCWEHFGWGSERCGLWGCVWGNRKMWV